MLIIMMCQQNMHVDCFSKSRQLNQFSPMAGLKQYSQVTLSAYEEAIKVSILSSY